MSDIIYILLVDLIISFISQLSKHFFKLTLTLLQPKVIRLFHQYKARLSMPLNCCLTNFLFTLNIIFTLIIIVKQILATSWKLVCFLNQPVLVLYEELRLWLYVGLKPMTLGLKGRLFNHSATTPLFSVKGFGLN